MATRGGWISLPLAVGVDRSHPQWPDLFFFFFSLEKSPERVVGGGVCSPEVGSGWRRLGLFGWLIR
jgi:hypothetical protein